MWRRSSWVSRKGKEGRKRQEKGIIGQVPQIEKRTVRSPFGSEKKNPIPWQLVRFPEGNDCLRP